MEITKGEWALTEDEDTFQIYVPTKFTIAKIHKRWGDDGKANAHLIAAAPKMYEQLQVMVIQLGFHKLTVADQIAIRQAREALAKAEGINNGS